MRLRAFVYVNAMCVCVEGRLLGEKRFMCWKRGKFTIYAYN